MLFLRRRLDRVPVAGDRFGLGIAAGRMGMSIVADEERRGDGSHCSCSWFWTDWLRDIIDLGWALAVRLNSCICRYYIW